MATRSIIGSYPFLFCQDFEIRRSMRDYRRYAEACRQMALTAIDPKMRDTLLEMATTLEAVASEREAPRAIVPSLNDGERK
jgi:hypothetical protein